MPGAQGGAGPPPGFALLAPIFPAGMEPLPVGTSPEEASEMRKMVQYQKILGRIPESCPFKVVLSGGMGESASLVYAVELLTGLGFALGGFVAMMSATFAYEDPLNKASTAMANLSTMQQVRFTFKEMGRNMWNSGRGFAKVGALYAGTECVIEGVSTASACWRARRCA